MNLLGKVLEDSLRKLESSAGLEARAVMLWPEIVGAQMAQASEARGFRDGTLLVTTRSSAWNQEFAFQKTRILARYRDKLGKEVVRDLRFSVGEVRGVPVHAAASPPEQEIRRIRLPASELEAIRAASEGPDPELAEAVRRALTREAQVRAWQLKHGARSCSRCGAAHRTGSSLCPACLRDDATADSPL